MQTVFVVIESFLRKIIYEEVSKVFHSLKLSSDAVINNEDDWVSLNEAKKIIPITSKRKWQELRDTGEIIFSKAGRSYVYNVNSLRNYLIKNSNSKK